MPDQTQPQKQGIDLALQRSAGRPARAWRIGLGLPGGFTLVELMTVVAVIALLAVIALPGYQQYVLRASRTAAQSLMLDLANREHQYFAANRTYATSTQLGFAMPADLVPYYTAAIALVAGPPPGFTITLTPVAGSTIASDGALMLDGTGKKVPADKWLK
jgi:type IV pilus assembly protein PilE